MIAKIG